MALVTVFITAYNQVRYIEQAVLSVLKQQTSSALTIEVLDDCSTDGTQNVLRQLQQTYTDRVALQLSPCNKCTNEALANALRASTADFVALLDGDDFYLSPYKLQVQIDFLTANEDFALCFHDAEIANADGTLTGERYCDSPPARTQLSHLWDGNYIPTCSALYRGLALRQIPQWYHNLRYGDWPLHLWAAQSGDICYLDEPMAAYRRYDGGLWSGLPRTEQIEGVIDFYESLRPVFADRYDADIRAAIARHFVMLAEIHEQAHDGPAAREAWAKAAAYRLRNHQPPR